MSGLMVCPITRPKRILVAMDGSEHSSAALSNALYLAKTCRTTLYVLSVVESNEEYETLAPKLVEKAEGEAKDVLDAAKHVAAQEGIDCEVISYHGEDPAEAIVNEAKKLGADMIVMGKHGKRRGLKRLLMGSTTEKVIGNAPCSVLVVKPEQPAH